MTDVAAFIEHYGVKGMKWGVRKKRSSVTDRTRYDKSPRRLTDDELKRRIQRMENEKKYNELNSRTVSKGEEIARTILRESGKTVATGLITGSIAFGVRKALKAKFGEDVQKAIYPQKKK